MRPLCTWMSCYRTRNNFGGGGDPIYQSKYKTRCVLVTTLMFDIVSCFTHARDENKEGNFFLEKWKPSTKWNLCPKHVIKYRYGVLDLIYKLWPIPLGVRCSHFGCFEMSIIRYMPKNTCTVHPLLHFLWLGGVCFCQYSSEPIRWLRFRDMPINISHESIANSYYYHNKIKRNKALHISLVLLMWLNIPHELHNLF